MTFLNPGPETPLSSPAPWEWPHCPSGVPSACGVKAVLRRLLCVKPGTPPLLPDPKPGLGFSPSVTGLPGGDGQGSLQGTGRPDRRLHSGGRAEAPGGAPSRRAGVDPDGVHGGCADASENGSEKPRGGSGRSREGGAVAVTDALGKDEKLRDAPGAAGQDGLGRGRLHRSTGERVRGVAAGVLGPSARLCPGGRTREGACGQAGPPPARRSAPAEPAEATGWSRVVTTG